MTPVGTTAVRRWGGAAIALLLASAMGTTGALADKAPDAAPLLYNASATGMGMGFVYDRVGFLALSPIFDTGFPRATVGADSTPSAGARGAPADPGLLSAGNAIAPVIGVPAGLTPPYPLFADASYPSGPAEAAVGVRQDAPATKEPFMRGLSGRASAERDRASAEARFARVDNEAPAATAARRIMATGAGRQHLGGLLHDAAALLRAAGVPVRTAESTGALVEFSAGESKSHVERSGSQLKVSGEGRMFGLSLLDGLFTIAEVRGALSVTWPRPDEKPVVTRTAVVSGAEFLGVPVTFSERGFEFQGTGFPVPVEEALNRMVTERGGVFRMGRFRTGGSRADVAALSFDFDGELQPDVPGLLSAERDIAHLTIGAAGATFFSQLAEPVPADDQVSGSTGSLAPVEQADSPSAAGGVQGNDQSDSAGYTIGAGPSDSATPTADSRGRDAEATPVLPDRAPSGGDAEVGMEHPGGSVPAAGTVTPRPGSEPGSGEHVAAGGGLHPTIPISEVGDPDAAGRLRTVSAFLAVGACLGLAAAAAGPIGRFLRVRRADDLLE